METVQALNFFLKQSRQIQDLQPKLTETELGNIVFRPWLYGPSTERSVLPRLWVNIPQYGTRARLVSGYYFTQLNGFSDMHDKRKQNLPFCKERPPFRTP